MEAHPNAAAILDGFKLCALRLDRPAWCMLRPPGRPTLTTIHRSPARAGTG